MCPCASSWKHAMRACKGKCGAYPSGCRFACARLVASWGCSFSSSFSAAPLRRRWIVLIPCSGASSERRLRGEERTDSGCSWRSASMHRFVFWGLELLIGPLRWGPGPTHFFQSHRPPPSQHDLSRYRLLISGRCTGTFIPTKCVCAGHCVRL